jgi:hypothetical protein
MPTTQHKPTAALPPPHTMSDYASQVDPVGALVAPEGNEVLAIDLEEYAILKNALHALRFGDQRLRAVVDTFGLATRASQEFDYYMRALLNQLGDAGRDAAGLLVERSGGVTVLELEGREQHAAAALSALVKVLRSGGWFADWLQLQIGAAAMDGEPLPTPFQVMQSLTLDAAEFEHNLNEARNLMKTFPQLFPNAAGSPDNPKELAQ